MDVTDITRRSDSLYYGSINRRDLCDKIAYLEADLVDARDAIRVLTETLRKLDGDRADG